MEDRSLLRDLHRHQQRQGPGSEAFTNTVIEVAGLANVPDLCIADIGCGTGVASLQLARQLKANVTAVDFLPEFIDELMVRAQAEGVAGRIQPMVASMDALPTPDGQYDVVWSEGAVYNMGFERGIREWRRLLKPGGLLILSEITWLTAERPKALQQFWETAYPEIATAAQKIACLQDHGYLPRGYLALPEQCWLDHYYLPLEQSFPDFLERHAHSEAARALVAAEQEEIALYRQYKAHYSYGMYIAAVPDCA